METDIGIAVAVLYPDDDIAARCYSWTLTGKLLVGYFCVKFILLNELLVKIKVIFIVWQQLSSCQQCIDKQIVKVGSHVEVVAFARIRPVGQIRCGQFTNGPKYCVCAACTEGWMQAKCFHKV